VITPNLIKLNKSNLLTYIDSFTTIQMIWWT